MKLSTMIVAATAVLGAGIATGASAATVTVSEGYNYSSGDYAYASVTTPVSLSDLSIAGTDFGAVGAGTYNMSIGDPTEGGLSSYAVSLTAGGVTQTQTFNEAIGDLDYTAAPTLQGSITVGSGVPETSTWIMMIAGFAGLGLFGMRSARKTAMAVA